MKLRITILILLVPFLILSWIKRDMLLACWISLFASLGVSFRELNAMPYWNFDLMEFWIAGVVWICCGIWLAGQLKFSPNSSTSKEGFAFITLLAILAATSPILVPVSPNIQGNLVTTKLLPPLSAGYKTAVVHEEDLSDKPPLEKARVRANGFLLNRSISISREEQPFAKRERIFFLFGTDDNARDVFSRVISGTRASLAVGGAAACGALVIGTLVGFVAGYSNRFTDSVLMRVTDIVLAIPSLFLVIGIMTFLGNSLTTLIVVLATTGWIGIARTVRTEVQKLKHHEFILVAKMLNQPTRTILLRHMLPNLKPLLLTAVVLQFGNAVLAEASLGFLGLGIQPPTASWGNMLGQSLGYVRTGWWLAVFPGLMLSSVLLAVHRIADRRTNFG